MEKVKPKPKPMALYVPIELVNEFDPLTALIASDLLYWIKHYGKRWDTYHKWADWFGVSYDSVMSRKNDLSQIFIIGRTTQTISDGRKVRGGNMYKLKQQRSHLVDIFNPVELRKQDIEVETFPLDFIKISSEVLGKQNVNFAWFLCRIGAIFHKHKCSSLNCRSHKLLSEITQTDRRSLNRYLEIAEQKKVLKVLDNEKFIVGLTKTGEGLLLTPFRIIDKLREQNRNEARLAGLTALCEDSAPYENVLIWANELAEREIGISIAEYVAKRDGLSGEDEALDQLYSNCQL